MRKIILTIAVLCIASIVIAQTYQGTVKDTKGEAIPFANVVLYSLPDSTFVAGTTTAGDGIFLLETEKAMSAYLAVSFIGYATQHTPAKENVGIITLKENASELGEVVIKGRRPTIRQEAGKMIVAISGSSLSEAGDLLDVFKRTPGLQVKDDAISVFGKGTPIVFINGREVHDATEYKNLQSDDIATIEIDRNPSAKYSASGKSVVRITTKKITKDRLNMQVYTRNSFARKFSTDNGVKLNSKWKKTEITANYGFEHSKSKDYDDAYELNTQPNYMIRNENYTVSNSTQNNHRIYVSLQQQIGEKHTLGAQYSYITLKRDAKDVLTQQITKTQATTSSLTNRLINDTTDYTYDLSIYSLNYRFDIDSVTNLQLLGDYTHVVSDNDEDISENNLTTNSLQQSNIGNENDYKVYSAKADLETTVAEVLPLETGVKYSEVKNDGNTLGSDILKQTEMYSTNNSTTDRISAAYVLCSPSFGDWDIEAGLRYEYTDRKIIATGSTVVDTTYGKWFPSLNISRDFTDNFGLSISYAKKIYRPTFSELNSNRSYIDSLSYSVGNPSLKATISHNFDMNISLFNSLYLSLGYEYNKQDRIMTAISDATNPDIVAYTSINIDKSEYLRATIDYEQSYKFWDGMLSVGIEQPFVKIPYLDEMKKIRKLSYYFQLNNDFNITENMTLFCNFSYNSPSESLMSYYYKSSDLSVGMNTSLFKDRIKLGVSVNDIFNDSETAWKDQYGNIESYSNQDEDNTYLRISLKYNFNKYRGGIRRKIAGSEEIGRMQN